MGVEVKLIGDKWYEKAFWLAFLAVIGILNFIRATMGYKPESGMTYRELRGERKYPKRVHDFVTKMTQPAAEKVATKPEVFHFRGKSRPQAEKYHANFETFYKRTVKVVQCEDQFYVIDDAAAV